jgi:hypothetical protein
MHEFALLRIYAIHDTAKNGIGHRTPDSCNKEQGGNRTGCQSYYIGIEHGQKVGTEHCDYIRSDEETGIGQTLAPGG